MEIRQVGCRVEGVAEGPSTSGGGRSHLFRGGRPIAPQSRGCLTVSNGRSSAEIICWSRNYSHNLFRRIWCKAVKRFDQQTENFITEYRKDKRRPEEERRAQYNIRLIDSDVYLFLQIDGETVATHAFMDAAEAWHDFRRDFAESGVPLPDDVFAFPSQEARVRVFPNKPSFSQWRA